GKFGGAAEIVIPASLELQRHFGSSSVLRTYLGVGMGAYHRKLYRTGADTRQTNIGVSFSTGANTVVTQHGLLGLDVRLTTVRRSNDPPNPVSGVGSGKLVPDTADPTQTVVEPHNGTIWGVKIVYSVAY